MQTKKYLFVVFLLVANACGNVLLAQNTMYFMDRMPQSLQYNPAFVPDMKLFIGLPAIGGISAGAYNTGFNYNELDEFIDNLGNDNYNPDDFVNSIGETNRFLAEGTANLFSFGFRLKEKGFLSFYYCTKSVFSVDAESDIAYLLADYDDISSDKFPLVVDGIDMKITGYTKLGFSYARRINENLTLGISPNIHYNMVGIKTEGLSYKVSLIEDEYGYTDYDETLDGQVVLGLPTEINPDAIDGDELDLDEDLLPDSFGDDLNAGDFFQNASFSMDLGATYQLDKWMFSASILNLGNSKWKKYGYRLTGAGDVVKIKHEKVKFNVPTSLYLGASRQFAPRWNYAVLFNSNFYESGANAAATISLNGVVGRALSTSVSYTAGYQFNNLGVGLRLRFFPGSDLFLVTDNIIQAFSFKEAQRLTAAIGINLSFGVKNGLKNMEEEMD
ncbi:MAG: DUF5723 family protein [Draconibacterium sp.]